MKKCQNCGRSEANHPLYDGVGKIKCKQFQPESVIDVAKEVADNLTREEGCGKRIGGLRVCNKLHSCPSCSKLKSTNESQISSSNHSPPSECKNGGSHKEPDSSDSRNDCVKESGSDFKLSDMRKILYERLRRGLINITTFIVEMNKLDKEFIRLRNELDSLLIAKKISVRTYCMRRDKLSGDLNG